MQVVRRELPTVAMQIFHRWHVRLLARLHADLFRHFVALAEIAGRAGSTDICPGGDAALGARNHMIKCQFTSIAAILAFKLVTEENIKAGKRRCFGGSDITLQTDHAWQLHGKGRARNLKIILSNYVHTVQKYCLDGILP